MIFKNWVSRYLLWRAATQVKASLLNLPLKLQGSRVLVLLPPDQQNLTIIKKSLPDMTRLFGENNVFLLASPGSNVQNIFPGKGFHFITPASSSVSWSGLPKKAFLDKLKNHRFDYIFDTNLEVNNFAARVLLDFPEAVRFGISGGPGEPYINLEVKTKYLRDRHLIYRSILEVINNLAQPESQAAIPTQE